MLDIRHGDTAGRSWCVQPQHFLNGAGEQLWLARQALPVLWMGGEMQQRRADRAPRGIHARHQDQYGHIKDHDIGNGFAVNFTG
ncbi:MAG: hypothetical protein VCE75_22435 [Alphaproteobacteria bacterium]